MTDPPDHDDLDLLSDLAVGCRLTDDEVHALRRVINDVHRRLTPPLPKRP